MTSTACSRVTTGSRSCARRRGSTSRCCPVAAPDNAQTTAGDRGRGRRLDERRRSRRATDPCGPSGRTPSNGTVTFVGNVAHYVPDAGFTGTDTFTYSICATTAPDLCSIHDGHRRRERRGADRAAAARGAQPGPGPSRARARTRRPRPAPDAGGVMAVTGAEPAPFVVLALVLMLGGGVLVRVARRRT